MQVLEREGALCRVALGEERLTILSFSAEETLSIEIPPEAVLIVPKESRPTLCSAENAFPTWVKKVRRLGQVTNLILAGGGFELNTLHTGRRIEDLGLTKGSEVLALVQATAIRTSPIMEGQR